jgi:hypothetical protein
LNDFLHLQIVSLLNGDQLEGDSNEVVVDTFDAFGAVNGRQVLASPKQIYLIQSHIQSYRPPLETIDLRLPIRKVEELLFQRHVGYLIGNQCVDFKKQDGVTEIEEAIQANAIERRLNDMLFQQELDGIVKINRQPIYVSTVSNFTNFLDLSRKTLRSLELGIPVVILCRTNQKTAQHSYRWVQLLIDLCLDAGIDSGMFTYISASLKDIKAILKVCEHTTGNLYTTCSRVVASDIIMSYPKTVASTGGPNTLVCTNWDSATNMLPVAKAIADSASIENAGQCTALRHCVVPTSASDVECQDIVKNHVSRIHSAETALANRIYAGILPHESPSEEPGNDYTRVGVNGLQPEVYAYVKVRPAGELPESNLPEFWRSVSVDFSKMNLLQDKQIIQGKQKVRLADEESLSRLASWLTVNQPISLAVNGPREEAINVGIKLWEQTALVVNTIGSTNQEDMPPAMTCQARPQDAECFGEFPPRNDMHMYTTFPVIIPSSNPSYDAVYKEGYLRLRGHVLDESITKSTKALLLAISEDAVRGFCVLLIEYLQNVCRRNPKTGFSTSRTVLFGIQRPPLGMKTVLRCSNDASWDDVAPTYLLFHVTNARDQVELSLSSDKSKLIKVCKDHNLPLTVESDEEFTANIKSRLNVFQRVTITGLRHPRFPMVGNFVSLYFPFGHIKSTMAKDDLFEMKSRISKKWLNTLF